MNYTARQFRPLFILLALAPLLLLSGIVPNAGAATIRVPAHQPTIQAGIDAATDGDTVLVADGTWTGEGNRNLDFGGKAITVRSQNGPDGCIIDCEESGRGFHLHGGEGRTTAIRGFRITRGGVYNESYQDWEAGGGIFCNGASPVIEGNIIVDCKGTGIFCSNNAAPLIVGNTISENGPLSGAGIACSGSSPVISNNLIHHNTAEPIGPGNGGGISCHDSAAVIAGNKIWANETKRYHGEFPGYGGGISATSFDGRIEDNLIIDNDAEGPGGGIYIGAGSPVVRNNLVINNRSDTNGGGISIESVREPLIIDNTIAWNTAGMSEGGGLFISTGFTGPAPGGGTTYTAMVHDCIIWGNSAGSGDQIFLTNEYSGDIALLRIRHSDVDGGEAGVVVEEGAQLDWGQGMIDEDPLFVTGPDGDYYLSQVGAGQPETSPCVNTGEPSTDTPWGTTRTDLVTDRGTGDMGYHYASPQRLVTGPGPGFDNPPEVRLFLPLQDAVPMVSFNAYGALRYGVNVTCGDVTGDGFDEIITGAGPGPIYGAHVRGFDGTGEQLPGLSFLAYGTHRWGVNVACGDVDGDSYDEIVTGAGPGQVFGAHVRIWDYDGSGTVTPWPTGSWFSYATPRWGVNVACGDLDGDSFDEIVTGPGPGAVFGPHVRGWNVDGGPPVPMPGVSFMAYGTFHYGVNVTCGDLDGDGIDEIVTAPGPSSFFSSHIRGWNVDGGTASPMPLVNFFAWPLGKAWYGARIYAGADLNGDGLDELAVGGGPDPLAGCPVKVFNFVTESPRPMFSLEAYSGLTMGTTVAGGMFPHSDPGVQP